MAAGDVRIGDYLLRYRSKGTAATSGTALTVPGEVTQTDTSKQDYSSWHGGGHFSTGLPPDLDVEWFVKRTRSLGSASKASGRWNQKCQRCGRGVYVGFTSVEHDGECR